MRIFAIYCILTIYAAITRPGCDNPVPKAQKEPVCACADPNRYQYAVNQNELIAKIGDKYLPYDMAFDASEEISNIEKGIMGCYDYIGTGTLYAVNGVIQIGADKMQHRYYICKKSMLPQNAVRRL